MELPVFKYHPDPVATGSIVESDAVCECCGEARGHVYTGPVFAEEEYDECICPWCIANGSAHEKLDASFTDEDGVGGYGHWDNVPDGIIKEVAHRTPGFSGWQQARWWTHCRDAAQFIGRAGREELDTFGADAMTAIRESTGLDEGPEWERLLASLDKEEPPTAYIFRCSKCGKLGGYQDCD